MDAMKQSVKMTGKVLLAGFVAFLLLCLFSLAYYNPPVHVPSPDGATDYIRDPGTSYAYLTEGMSYGTIDANGYNNIGAAAQSADSPNVLFMGSSHIEAMYVMQNESAPFLLDRMLDEAKPGASVYNIGMSAHTLITCLNNLDAALAAYRPKDYVVIETMESTFSIHNLSEFAEGTLAELHADAPGGFMYYVQQIPFAKLAYFQYRNARQGSGGGGGGGGSAVAPAQDDDLHRSLLFAVMQLYSDKARAAGVTPVIVFHSQFSIREDGSVSPRANMDDLALFKEACAAAGVVLIDMTEPFLARYALDYTLPHGFLNTEIGSGHLNPAGQRMVAEELYRVMLDGISA